jgi:hypothetical protein
MDGSPSGNLVSVLKSTDQIPFDQNPTLSKNALLMVFNGGIMNLMIGFISIPLCFLFVFNPALSVSTSWSIFCGLCFLTASAVEKRRRVMKKYPDNQSIAAFRFCNIPALFALFSSIVVVIYGIIICLGVKSVQVPASELPAPVAAVAQSFGKATAVIHPANGKLIASSMTSITMGFLGIFVNGKVLLVLWKLFPVFKKAPGSSETFYHNLPPPQPPTVSSATDSESHNNLLPFHVASESEKILSPSTV